MMLLVFFTGKSPGGNFKEYDGFDIAQAAGDDASSKRLARGSPKSGSPKSSSKKQKVETSKDNLLNAGKRKK